MVCASGDDATRQAKEGFSMNDQKAGTNTERSGDGHAGNGGLAITHEEPARWLPRLKRCLGEQLEIVRLLDELSRMQSEALGEGEMDRVLAVLAQREPRVRRMVELSAELEPFLRYFGELRAGVGLAMKLTPSEREVLRGQIELIDEHLRNVTERDETDQRLLAHRREEMSQELAQTVSTRGAIGAYAQPVPGGPAMQDFKA
jgi:hypothetical protein